MDALDGRLPYLDLALVGVISPLLSKLYLAGRRRASLWRYASIRLAADLNKRVWYRAALVLAHIQVIATRDPAAENISPQLALAG
jgi:hypothetical protein